LLDGISFRLRPWQDADLSVLTELRNDIAIQAQLLARARGSRSEQVREWLQRYGGQSDRFLLIIAARETDETLGFTQVTDMNSLDGHADVGICLIKQAQGRGLCKHVLDLLGDHLCSHWHLRKLNLRVRADNIPALRCYEKAGFERCGLLRRHIFIDDHWQDVVLMERFLAGAE
jgi:RimJ/RimL family protein N-acetyltransferase